MMQYKRTILIMIITGISFFYSCSNDSPTRNEDNDPADIGELIDKKVNSHINAGDPGMVLAVVYDHQVVFNKGYGMANIQKGLKATPRTPYYLCSISKSFTAIAVLICAERGLLDYQDKIRDYFPEYPESWQHITIHHLLTHQNRVYRIFSMISISLIRG